MTDTKLDSYLFHQGTNFQSYKLFGAHKTENGKYRFVTWAPNADGVEVVGDFNSWGRENTNTYRMKKISDKGIWEIFCEINCGEEFFYKFKIFNDGKTFLKSDPYAFFSETEGKTASIFYELKNYLWEDSEWIKYTENHIPASHSSSLPIPMNIYEVHLGSVLKSEKGECLNYREYADNLAPYLKKMGYTHIELLPIFEHPFGGSWGYQVTGYYAPTSRYGKPEDFKYFINKMHICGIGVILDWVPAHFPKDESGLADFDGGKCYEYQGKWKSEHRNWGTRCFDVGRPEVQSFLISNADFWIREYHIDALRIDAVASMLYLDYDRKSDEWVPNTYGTNENLEAVAFFKKLNSYIHSEHKRIIVIAEESTEWKNVTRKENDFGLGFDLKWNMGWMHDTLDYCSSNPYYRSSIHNKLTFSLLYAFSERFVLPISHDEVVHGKKSLLDKFYGDYEEKFKTFRTFYAYMMSHPGKKMLFMGCEYGQFSEWNYEKSLEWFMTDFERHKQLRDFVAEMNNFYLKNSEFWENDFSWEGFHWIISDDNEQNIIVFERLNLKKEKIICVFNFSPIKRENYRIGADGGEYDEIFTSNQTKFGDEGFCNKAIKSEQTESHGYANSLKITIPGYTALFLKKSKITKKQVTL